MIFQTVMTLLLAVLVSVLLILGWYGVSLLRLNWASGQGRRARVEGRRKRGPGTIEVPDPWSDYLDGLAADVQGTSLMTLVEAAEQRAEDKPVPRPALPPAPGAASPPYGPYDRGDGTLSVPRHIRRELHHPVGIRRCGHGFAPVLTGVTDPDTGEYLGDVDCCPRCYKDVNGVPPPPPGRDLVARYHEQERRNAAARRYEHCDHEDAVVEDVHAHQSSTPTRRMVLACEACDAIAEDAPVARFRAADEPPDPPEPLPSSTKPGTF